ncbi:MAG TPA: DUF4255 domain-containing protein [Lysobacter sp.]|jgi:hypothetical protein|nr:DUF4255 domain-containing protein [Lysobacter sp.]
MANIAAIRSVGSSLAAYLNNAYRDTAFPPNVTKPECTFSLTSIGGVRAQDVPSSDTTVRVLIFLYRASINHHLRNAGRLTDAGMRPVPLSVDLHYLFSFWAQSGENEQLVLAWTMRQLHEVPVLDSSILSREAAWAAEDLIQLIPEEISTEDLMRIWDTLEPNYRLSLSYIARVVRIDPDQSREERQVVATRFDYAVPAPQR